MKYFKVIASDRQATGTRNSKRIRTEEGLVPAIVYGVKKETKSISLFHKELLRILKDNAVFTSVIELKFPSGNSEEVILKDIQYHPFKNKILHVDLMRVDRKKKIDVHVPINFTGLESSLGKKAGGIFTKHSTAIDIRCLPEDIVESIKIDVSAMKIDESIHVSEISLPDNIELVKKPTEQDDPAIISVHLPKSEVTEENAEASE